MAGHDRPDIPADASGVIKTDTRTEITVKKSRRPAAKKGGAQNRPAKPIPGLNETVFLSPECRLTVGRSDACDIIVKDPVISHQHFTFFGQGPDVHIQDLKSKNGTFVNGEKTSRQKLNDGDVITFGGSKMTFYRLDTDGADA